MRQKLGDWILDVAKYIFTVGILAPFLKTGIFNEAIYYSALVVIVTAMLGVGLLLSIETNRKMKGSRK